MIRRVIIERFKRFDRAEFVLPGEMLRNLLVEVHADVRAPLDGIAGAFGR